MTKSQWISVAEARQETHIGKTIEVRGWVRTRRDSKGGFSFIEVNDGSCLGNLQVVADQSLSNYEADVLTLSVGSSLVVAGELKPSQGQGQKNGTRSIFLACDGDCRSEYLSSSEETPYARKASRMGSPSPPHQYHWSSGSRSQSHQLFNASILPRRRLCIHPHPDHYSQRLRRCWPNVSRDDTPMEKPPMKEARSTTRRTSLANHRSSR